MKAQSRQRSIQNQVSKADKIQPCREAEPAMQAGARDYPVPRFPKQHQSKPVSEQQFNPVLFCDAPFYRGSGKLADKVALITGGDSDNASKAAASNLHSNVREGFMVDSKTLCRIHC
jgi:hypothetical protein